MDMNDVPAVDSLFEFEGLRLPSLDVIDRDTEVVVRAEIPGIEKKDINVSLADNVLTIKVKSAQRVKKKKAIITDMKSPVLHLPVQCHYPEA